MRAKNLYEQMSPTTRTAVAMILGFEGEPKHGLFATNLERIPPMPINFTIGDVVIAYCNEVVARVSVQQDIDRIA